VLEPITEVFAEIGRILGVILAPILRAITPILQALEPAFRALAIVISVLWNAIATFINALLGWVGVHLETINIADLNSPGATNSGGKGALDKPTWTGWSDVTSAATTVGIQAAPTPVVATPGWVHTFGSHVERFGAYVTRLVEEGIRVQVNGTAAATGAGGVWNRAVAGELG